MPRLVRPHPHRTPWPVTLTVKTLPPLPNLTLALDGEQANADSAGVVRFVQQHNLAPHTLNLVTVPQDDRGSRYRFTRWIGGRDPAQINLTTLTGLPMRKDYSVTAAFTVQYAVQAVLRTQRGNPVSMAATPAVVLKSNTGLVATLAASGPSWLDGLAPSFKDNTPSITKLSYSVESVMVRGTNVVDAGRQSFQPATQKAPVITAQFYDLTIGAHDALFGTALGDHVTLRYPDGTTMRVQLDQHHQATVVNLPRGRYTVAFSAGKAITTDQRITLSRNKTLDGAAITRLDLLVPGCGLAVMALLLLLIGRPGWVRRPAVALTRLARQTRRRSGNAEPQIALQDLLR